jgi:hypothetical protein
MAIRIGFLFLCFASPSKDFSHSFYSSDDHGSLDSVFAHRSTHLRTDHGVSHTYHHLSSVLWWRLINMNEGIRRKASILLLGFDIRTTTFNNPKFPI